MTVSEVARRIGMRAPSVDKYFDSLHAIYDGLFARGQARLAQTVDEAVRDRDPGLDRLLVGHRAFVEWSTREPGLASLMFWRPVPGFVPGIESMTTARDLLVQTSNQPGATFDDGLYTSLTDEVLAMFVQHYRPVPG